MSRPEDIIESRKRWEEYKFQYWKENCPEEYAESVKRKQLREQQRLQGVIFDSTIKKWLDSEINMARFGLIISMLFTALIKGQFVIWLILLIAYKFRVSKAKKDATDADRRKDKYYE